MISLKGAYKAPTSGSIRLAMRELGMAYPARAAWSRTCRSSRRLGRPVAWRRAGGVFDIQRKGGMHIAESRNGPEYHSRARPTRITTDQCLPIAVQSHAVPACLWE